jgi:alpha-D-ribose 1-methylphosphonate 5-triphosphate diphosphatase
MCRRLTSRWHSYFTDNRQLKDKDIEMTCELILKNAKIVTPDEIVEGTVIVRGGLIADVQSGPVELEPAVDFEGDYLIPGLVDLHTDNFERHVRPRNNADWPVMAALLAHDAQMVSAGITTIFDSLYVGIIGFGSRGHDTLQKTIAELDYGRRNGMFRGDHMLHLRAEVSKEEMPEMFSSVYPESSVRLVSVMDHTPGQRQWRDIEKYVAMEKRDYKLPQEEIDEFLKTSREQHQRVSGPNRAKVLSMVEGHSIALASHDDTTAEHVEAAHAEGITICEFPTTAEAAQTARNKGMHIVAGSPNLVLGRSHSGNVSAEELARRGLLDALASDYVPSSLLHGAFVLKEKIGIPLPQAFKMINLAPALMVGLHDRGSIEVGKRADLVRVKMAKEIPLPVMVWREGVRV